MHLKSGLAKRSCKIHITVIDLVSTLNMPQEVSIFHRTMTHWHSQVFDQLFEEDVIFVLEARSD